MKHAAACAAEEGYQGDGREDQEGGQAELDGQPDGLGQAQAKPIRTSVAMVEIARRDGLAVWLGVTHAIPPLSNKMIVMAIC